jgi:Kef-type K+ transport system membrane component KefB
LSSTLSLILIVGAAFIAAHVLFEWLARRFRIVSGAEYLVLGILLGPYVTGFMGTDVVRSFAPFMTLALGWTGAAVGMQLHLPKLIQTRSIVYRTALLEASIAFIAVTGVMVAAFSWAFSLTYSQVILPAVTLGAIAVASASSALPLFGESDTHPLVEQLETTALIDSVFAIVVFGLLLCMVHVEVPLQNRLVQCLDLRPDLLSNCAALTDTEWAAIAIAIGVVGGTLFHLFIGEERNPDRLFIALAGAIILASGATAYLRLSPLFSGLIIGAILVNTSVNREEIVTQMASIEKPLYFVLLIFAGASWQPSHQAWVLPVVLFVFMRIAAKLGAARLAVRIERRMDTLGKNWGRVLFTQGTLALAIALNYSINDTQIVPNVVFTAAVLSVMVNDLFAARIITALLDDTPDEVPQGAGT